MYRIFMRMLGLLLIIIIAGVLVLTFGPRQQIDVLAANAPEFDIVAGNPEQTALNAADYLAASEAAFTDIKPNQQKQIIWATGRGQKTPLSIVYLHGFSASAGEIRPVPDNIGKALGANVFFTRLTGHGRPGDAMGNVHVQQWAHDLKEAIAVGSVLGEKVVVLTASTGGTLAAVILDDADLSNQVSGIIFVSPNFAVKNGSAFLAKLPYFDKWGPILAGKTRSWEPANAQHGEYWTTSYPTKSVVPMMRLIDHVEDIDFSNTKIPVLFYFSDKDTVVDATTTRQIMAKWGGQVSVINPTLTAQDDVDFHVIAGDIKSPNQTGPASAAMIEWITGLQ